MILVILLAVKEAVAINSIIAMLFRTSVWSTIILLLRRKNNLQHDNE